MTWILYKLYSIINLKFTFGNGWSIIYKLYSIINIQKILNLHVWTPRIGDEQFGEYMKEVVRKHGIKYERFVYNNDIVPGVPFDDKILFSYKHMDLAITSTVSTKER